MIKSFINKTQISFLEDFLMQILTKTNVNCPVKKNKKEKKLLSKQ